jgi:hypothetical protein
VECAPTPAPPCVARTLGLEDALGESGSQGRRFYGVRTLVAGSASRGGCVFRGRHFPRFFSVLFSQRKLRHLALECQHPVATSGCLRLLANPLSAGRWIPTTSTTYE